MTPTNRLRFVEREVRMPTSDPRVFNCHMIRILQQWWEPDYPGSAMDGEWRDIPLEVEE